MNKKKKVTAVIAARTGSSRMPGKVIKPILGKPMIERMVERIRCSKYVSEVIVATTTLEGDDQLASLAGKIGIGCFRGSADDVLHRINSAVSSSAADLVIEILGDNPLVHSDLIDDVIDFYSSKGMEYAANVTTEYPQAGPNIKKFPIGIRVQVFAPEVLARCEKTAKAPYYRENSTAFICENPQLFSVGYFEARGKWKVLNRPELTFAVNYPENFDLIVKLFEKCYKSDRNFSLFEALRTFDDNPELADLMGVPKGIKA